VPLGTLPEIPEIAPPRPALTPVVENLTNDEDATAPDERPWAASDGERAIDAGHGRLDPHLDAFFVPAHHDMASSGRMGWSERVDHDDHKRSNICSMTPLYNRRTPRRQALTLTA